MKRQMIEGAFHVLNYWTYTLNFKDTNEKKYIIAHKCNYVKYIQEYKRQVFLVFSRESEREQLSL